MLRILVCDTGTGIPDEKQRDVFLEFQRLEAGEHAGKRGLGLGLAIVERIGALLGHDIWLRSQLGRGTMIGMDVPLAQHPVAERRQPRIVGGAEGDAGGQLILCIDNEAAIQQGLSLIHI